MCGIVQLCCTGQGEVHLPKESGDILPYMRSVKGDRPPPQWVFKVVDMLLESEQRGDTTITFKSLKLRAFLDLSWYLSASKKMVIL